MICQALTLSTGPRNNAGNGSGTSTPVRGDGFIETAFPAATSLTSMLANKALRRGNTSQNQKSTHLSPASIPSKAKRPLPRAHIAQRRLLGVEDHPVAEAIFFQYATPSFALLRYLLTIRYLYRYGVVVFFGFSQHSELDILDDLLKRGIMVGEKRVGENQQYEIESFHFEYDPAAPTPRIYNDFFSEFVFTLA
jgi:hypothetical protein